MLIAAYIPTWEGAVSALPVQILLIGPLVWALSLYLRRRHSPTVTTVTLATGFHAGALAGLVIFGLRVRSLVDLEAAVVSYVELRFLGVASMAGLILSWLVLEGVTSVTDRGGCPVPAPDTQMTPLESRHLP